MSKTIPLSTYDQVICLTQSNNWLKMHGYPMRRKPRGTRKEKRLLVMDEISLLFQPESAQDFIGDMLKNARRYTPPTPTEHT